MIGHVDWPERELGELCEDVTVGHVGPMAAQYRDSGIPFLRSQDIKPFRIELSNTKFISQDFHQRLRKSALKPGDVAVIRTGYPGTAAVVPDSLPIANCADLVIIRPGADLEPRYIVAIFNSAWGRAHVGNSTVGAAQQHFNVGTARKLKLRLPPLPTQRRIAGILSAYDDLIENNTKRIKILEEMARALYREWFVHFRFPGHEKVKLVDSPLGQIPEGWTTKPLSEVADCRLGKMLDKKKNRGDLMPYLGNLNVRWGGFNLGSLKQMRIEPHETEKYGLKHGDIVMCEGGEPGRCAIWKEEIPGMMYQKAIHRIRARAGVAFEYLYQCLRERAQSGRLAALFTGSTIKHLPGVKLAKVEIQVPASEVMESFRTLVGPIEEQIKVLQSMITCLAQTRDLLLPLLISGEIDVDNLDLPEAAQ